MLRRRLYAVFFVTAFLFGVLFFRLFFIQVMGYEKFSIMAQEQHNQILKIEPRRGTIYDRFMEPLAINLDASSIYADPQDITDKSATARALSRVLNMDENVLIERFDKKKAFVWVKRKVTTDEAASVQKLGLKGIHFLTESKRSYPNDNLASHIIGFAGMDNNGLEGLELRLDDKLNGEPGLRHLIRDARLRPVLDMDKDSVPAENGCNVVLTIDSVIQFIAENEIEKMAKEFNASSATAIVMEPYSGKILALANYPDYNLNNFRGVSKELVKNPAVSSVMEPGSVFKVVTASAALDEKTFKLDDEFYCENGEYGIAGRTLHDYHPYGKLKFWEVFAHSSNIGTVKIAIELGAKKIYDYIRKFGFGENTGIDLPGEVPGICRHPSEWSKSDITTIPIGQGIAVTPIQLASAISVIANGGYLMRPYVIEQIRSPEGEVIEERKPYVRRKVVDASTCAKVTSALRQVVVVGTGQKANSEKYPTCGKTGTAQLVNPNGGYYQNKYIATFIGFAPYDKPVISIVVIAREPHPAHFGGTVAGPAFRNIAEKTMQYLESNVL